jgi:hypothetical protein
LERPVLLLVEKAADTRREHRRLDKAHETIYANGVLRASARSAA